MRSRLLWALLAIGPLLAPGSSAAPGAPEENETLRQYADKLGIGIGSAIQGRYWNQDTRVRETVGKEFNRAVSILPMRFPEPQHDRFHLGTMDHDIAFPNQHNMNFFGTTLIYRNPHA